MEPTLVALINFGVLGIVFVLFLLGQLEAKPAIEERKKREAEKDALIKQLTDGLTGAVRAWRSEQKLHHGGIDDDD